MPTYLGVLWDASAVLGSKLLVISTFSPPCSLPAAAPPPPPPQRCATLPRSDIPIKTQTTSKSAGSTRLGLCQTYFIFNDGPSIQFICAFSSHPYLYFVYVNNNIADDPSGETGCSTKWNKNKTCCTFYLMILLRKIHEPRHWERSWLELRALHISNLNLCFCWGQETLNFIGFISLDSFNGGLFVPLKTCHCFSVHQI